jgi:hypothetical protein
VSRTFDRFMVHVHIGSHPKFARLTDAEFRAVVAGVLPLAAMSSIRGRLLIADQPVEPRDVAHQARVSTRVASSAMEKLRAVGVIVPDEELNCERVHDFEDWNPAPKVDTTNAERQARYRAKLKTQTASRNAVTNGVVTPRITPPEVEGEGKNPPVGVPPVSVTAPSPPARPDTRGMDWKARKDAIAEHEAEVEHYELEMDRWATEHFPQVHGRLVKHIAHMLRRQQREVTVDNVAAYGFGSSRYRPYFEGVAA